MTKYRIKHSGDIMYSGLSEAEAIRKASELNEQEKTIKGISYGGFYVESYTSVKR